MQEVLAWLLLVAFLVFIVFPVFGAVISSGTADYLEAMGIGGLIFGIIATVIGVVVAGVWSLDVLGVIDTPRF